MSIKSRHSGGFSLVEIALALGVLAFCLAAILGLLPTGLNAHRAAIAQTDATSITTAIYADLKGTPKGETKSSAFALPLDANSPVLYFKEDGTLGARDVSRYRAQVFLTGGSGKGATTGRIVISWPAQQDDVTKASGTVETFIALDRS